MSTGTSSVVGDRTVKIALLTCMVRIRRFEERVKGLWLAGRLPDQHLAIGQEAIAAGVCAALRDDDYVNTTHRCHAHVIAKGADLNRCMAELFGRESGYCKGKGGEMHIADLSLGIIGANGIVAAGLPIATGAGLSAQMRGTDQVSVAFFGDGASRAGAFHESLNLAAIWSLPTIFVCENNGWTELTRMEEVTARGEIAQHGEAYGIPGLKIDGNDAPAVHAVAAEAVARARAGHGPTLIEAVTYRIEDHSGNIDVTLGDGRSDAELGEWRDRDPIRRLRAALVGEGVDAGELDRIDAQAAADVDGAVEFALASPLPPIESAFQDMWCEVAEVPA